MTGTKAGGQGIIEVITGDIEAHLEREAKTRKVDEGVIDHVQDLPENTEVKRLDIVRDHQEGSDRGRPMQTRHEENRTGLIRETGV